MNKLLGLIGCGLVLAAAAAAEPPPRDQRAPPASGPDQRPPFLETDWTPSYPLPVGWRPRYFHYETRYEVETVADETIIKTFADGTASWIARRNYKTIEDDEAVCLNWKWSADELPKLSAPEDSLAGDDFAIRVYVFGVLGNGKTFGFNYVWAVEHAVGDIWTSPWSKNKLMALRQGPNSKGELVAESRDLVSDITAATGVKPVALTSIAVMTDAEGSGSVARARIGPITTGACNGLVS